MTAIENVQKLIADQKLIVNLDFSVAREIVVSLRGETYENRAAIKEAGFKWNGRAWTYSAKPNADDAMLMAFAREYTEGKLEQAKEETRRASLTDEERELEQREFSERMEASRDKHHGLSRKMRARGLSK